MPASSQIKEISTSLLHSDTLELWAQDYGTRQRIYCDLHYLGSPCFFSFVSPYVGAVQYPLSVLFQTTLKCLTRNRDWKTGCVAFWQHLTCAGRQAGICCLGAVCESVQAQKRLWCSVCGKSQWNTTCCRSLSGLPSFDKNLSIKWWNNFLSEPQPA